MQIGNTISKLRIRFVLLAIIIILLINSFGRFYNFSPPENNFDIKISMLDIGQGDSILIENEIGEHGLIDLGKQGELMPELKRNLGYSKRLSFVVATHPDSDHTEGLLEIIDFYAIEKLFITSVFYQSDLGLEVISKAEQSGVIIHFADEFYDFRWGCCINFDFLWPKKGLFLDDPNESSIALLISLEDLRIYTAGDLGRDNELVSLQGFDKDVDILKIGHHGSNSSTSQEFIDKINPKVALISVGKNNSYGHPTDKVLSLLNRNSINTYRTDNDGEIVIEYKRGADAYSICSSSGCKNFTL